MRRFAAVGAAVAASSLLVAGCGGGGSGSSAESASPSATAPASVAAPVAVSAVAIGGAVTAGPTTPKPVAAALKGSGVVVVAFVQKGVADDDAVAAAVAQARKDPVSRRGTAFFEYDIAKDHFGDLADRLGVSGTPSVAVIGRDRTLVHLWTGLIDADILRQSIADAQDTVAAHPGAKAVTGSPGAKTSATGPTGDAAGIALAKKVNASYATVPGIGVEFTVTAKNGTKAGFTGSFVIANGHLGDNTMSGTVRGQKLDLVSKGDAEYGRPEGQACWVKRAGASPGTPFVRLGGARFSAPRTVGDEIVLRAVGPDANGVVMPITYRIDSATSHVKSFKDADSEGTFEVLESAPVIPDPSPVCGSSGTT